MPESSNKGGRIPRVSDADLLDVFRSTTDPVLSTAEVADQVPIKRRGVLNRLRGLEDAGDLESKQIGGRNTVWWLVDEESGDTGARADAARDATDGPTEPPADAHGADDDAPGAPDFFVDLRAEIPGSGEHLDGRIQAVRDIYEYLQKEGSGRRSDFKDVVDVEATGYKNFNSFYTNCLDNGALLAGLGGVRSPGEGGHNYTYES